MPAWNLVPEEHPLPQRGPVESGFSPRGKLDFREEAVASAVWKKPNKVGMTLPDRDGEEGHQVGSFLSGECGSREHQTLVQGHAAIWSKARASTQMSLQPFWEVWQGLGYAVSSGHSGVVSPSQGRTGWRLAAQVGGGLSLIL